MITCIYIVYDKKRKIFCCKQVRWKQDIFFRTRRIFCDAITVSTVPREKNIKEKKELNVQHVRCFFFCWEKYKKPANKIAIDYFFFFCVIYLFYVSFLFTHSAIFLPSYKQNNLKFGLFVFNFFFSLILLPYYFEGQMVEWIQEMRKRHGASNKQLRETFTFYFEKHSKYSSVYVI